MGSAKYIDWVGLTGSHPRAAPAKRLSTWTMTREAITVGFDAGDGFLDRTRGSDFTRFRCAGRRFVSISHPDYVDHVLHEARLKYVKSNEYEPIRAAAGVNLVTDEGDSWAAHRGAYLRASITMSTAAARKKKRMSQVIDRDAGVTLRPFTKSMRKRPIPA